MNYYSNRNSWVIHDKIPNYKLVKDVSYSWDAMISNNHLKKKKCDFRTSYKLTTFMIDGRRSTKNRSHIAM